MACDLLKYALLTFLAICTSQDSAVAGQRSITQRAVQVERSNALTLTINGVSKQLLPGDLFAMPQTRVTVHNGHSNRDEVYSGVSLSDLLSANGLPFTQQNQRTYLRSYLRVQGTDFYFVIYSAAEVTPDLNTSKVIVATHVNGRDLGQEGQFKLVSTEDTRPARWVRNLLSITFTTIN